MPEKLPALMTDMNPQTQNKHSVLCKINPRNVLLRETQNGKDAENLKTARKRYNVYNDNQLTSYIFTAMRATQNTILFSKC